MINWDKVAKLSTWIVIVAVALIMGVELLNLIFP